MEYKTSTGRVDAITHTNTHIYIFEFKLDKTAEEALAQIKNKEYYTRFINSGKKITLIGANFNSTAGKIDKYIPEEIYA